MFLRKKPFFKSLICLFFFQNSYSQSDLIFRSTFEIIQTNVFISGHSLMDNPFAEYIEAIAIDKGINYNWNQQIGLGSPIRVRTSGNQPPPNNWQGYRTGKNRNGFDMDIIAELANPATIGDNQNYDTLLITERTDIFDTVIWENTNSLLRHYHDRLLTSNTQSETLLYQSWWSIDPSDPQAWIDHVTAMLTMWECVTEKVNLTLSNDGFSPSVKVVPAGWALTRLLERILNNEVTGFTGSDAQKIDLLFDDNNHLNTEGIFYVAAISYASLFNQSPEGAQIPANINPTTGEELLQIAWQSVQQYQTNFTTKTMPQCRTIIENELCSQYYNFVGRPEQINSCQTWISNNSTWQINPFNWPDPDLITWPDP